MQITPIQRLPLRPAPLDRGRFSLGGGRPLYEAWDATPLVGAWRGYDSPAFTADQVMRFARRAARYGLVLDFDEGARRLRVTNHRGQVQRVDGQWLPTRAGQKLLFLLGSHVYRWQRVA